MCESERWGARGCGGNGDAERQDGGCLRTLDGHRGQLKGRVRRPVTGGGPFPPVSAGALRLAGMCEGERRCEPEKQNIPARFDSGRDVEERQLPTLPPGGAVPSAMTGLTSLFGMGRGGSPPL